MLLPARHIRALSRHAISFPFARAFLISLLLWLTAFALCKRSFWRDPHSAFFKSDHVYEMRYSSYRKAEAGKLIEANNDTAYQSEPKPLLDSNPIICAAYVTVNRPTNYLNDSIGSMLEGLYPEERRSMY